MLTIRSISVTDKDFISDTLCENWGSTLVVTKGKLHDASVLPGFIAEIDGEISGLITYCIDKSECEIVTLNSFAENKGVGGRLIEAVINTAVARDCHRIWLITTNDNTNAIRYYQKIGFSLINIYIDSVNLARKIKPQIPLRGFDDIPILHEIEFEKRV